VAGDSVDLAGNWVTFGTITADIGNLELGPGGQLAVTSGRLNVGGETGVGAQGGEIDVRFAGQLWLNGYNDRDALDLDVDGGRFANTGFFDGLLDMHVTDGQALLGVDDGNMTLGNGSRLEIEGSTARVGFDGAAGGTASLRLEAGSELRMTADENGFSKIGEFRSGALENDAPNVLSAFDMGEGTILIDVTAIAGGGPRQEILVDTDEVYGTFSDVEFIGLGRDQDATLTVDYDNDVVAVWLGAVGAGSGRTSVATLGNMLNAMDDGEVWDVLTEAGDTFEEDDRPAPETEIETEDEEPLFL
jgi:hypothetical protein